MRKLHPVHARERLVARGSFRRAEGEERWTLHALPAERHVLRVQDERAGLWHLALDDAGLPERLQVRMRHEARRLDATFTFFEDEVLVWRRGAEPASEAVALPPGTRLLWPPLAGRLRCLGFGTRILAADQPEAVMTALVRPAPPARGLLTVRPVKFTVRDVPSASEAEAARLRLETPGLPVLSAALDDGVEALRWWEESSDEEGGPPTERSLGERVDSS